MTMTIDELLAEAEQLQPSEQEELVHRLLALRGRPPHTSVLPPATHGTVWLANLKDVQIDHETAEEMIRVIEEECERIDPNDWT
jgi:hypothetical protein